MQFISINYLIFIILTAIIYYLLKNTKAQKYVLLIASTFFFAMTGIEAIVVLFVMIVLSYYGYRCIIVNNSMVVLYFFIVITLLPLLCMKYLAYILNLLNIDYSDTAALPYKTISLFSIMGISFFTFKMIAFLVDAYRETKGNNETNIIHLVDYMIYIMFFPTIASGPIDRPRQFINQININKDFSLNSAKEACFYIVFGFFEKAFLADTIAGMVNSVYANYSICTGWFLFSITMLYSLQIYFDFAGYTFIARGSALLFGYNCSENFMAPYFSRSVSEFWGRWHMSLSTCLRDYVYIPLGGNRKGKIRKNVNLLITFFVSGLWHGTGVAFIVWGLLHAVYQIVGAIILPIRKKLITLLHIPTVVEKILETIITFLLVNIAWIFFSAPNGINGALGILANCLQPTTVTWSVFLDNIGASPICISMLAIGTILVFIIDYYRYSNQDIYIRFSRQKTIIQFIFLYFIIICTLVYGQYGPGFDSNSFIYTNF